HLATLFHIPLPLTPFPCHTGSVMSHHNPPPRSPRMMTRPALALLAAACLVLCLSPAARAQPAAPPPAQTPPREDADFTDGELGEHLAAAARRAGARGFSGAVL